MIWKFLTDGGPAMAPILFCSVLALAVLLERSWFWLTTWWRTDRALEQALTRLAADPRRAETSRDPVCRVLATWLSNPHDPTLATHLAERILDASRAGLGLLQVTGGVATSLGLFGTVLGVSLAFEHTISTGQMSELTGSLSVALNTTMFGLLVFIPCYAAGALFQTLTDKQAARMERALTLLRSRLRARGGRAAATSATPPTTDPHRAARTSPAADAKRVSRGDNGRKSA